MSAAPPLGEAMARSLVDALGSDCGVASALARMVALRQSGISAVFLARFWSKLTFWDQAAWLVTHWPDIERLAANTTMGTYAEIQQNGAVRLIDVD